MRGDGSVMRLCVLAEAIRLAREAYGKTQDRRMAAAALALAELALHEAQDDEQEARDE